MFQKKSSKKGSIKSPGMQDLCLLLFKSKLLSSHFKVSTYTVSHFRHWVIFIHPSWISIVILICIIEGLCLQAPSYQIYALECSRVLVGEGLGTAAVSRRILLFLVKTFQWVTRTYPDLISRHLSPENQDWWCRVSWSGGWELIAYCLGWQCSQSPLGGLTKWLCND